MNISRHRSPISLGLPPLHLFHFPPSQPQKTATPLPPTVTTKSFLRPIPINPTVFHASLDLQFPLTFALIYITGVILLNRFNAGRQHKPWSFSKTSTFRSLVITHNALLALFSAWTFYGICQTVHGCWPRDGPDYYAHVAEMICETDSRASWVSANTKTLWEEGSAYIGWIFYMSKFYEIVDTLVILARGKKSSLLQTYHHAGVLICGWASLKYESPAYLVGIVLNSGIHTLMYTYFTVQSLGLSIPMTIKRSLTSLQIAQFVTGFFWGYGYLFVKYNAPLHIMKEPVVNGPTLGVHSRMDYGHPSMRNAGDMGDDSAVSCLSDSGEAFTIWLTTVYVLPLLLLFVRFFMKSYVKAKTV